MNQKKRSPKEVIEKSRPFGDEHAYVKASGSEPIEVSDTPQSFSVGTDYGKVERQLEEIGAKKYTHIHTHPIKDRWRYFMSPENEVRAMIYPSGADLLAFMRDNKRKVEVIAARGSSSGKVYGYMVLRKTKKTPQLDIDHQEGFNPIILYGQESYHHKSIDDRNKSLEKLIKSYHLQFKVIGLNRIKSKETTIAVMVSIVCILGSMTFLSSNITGNAIGNLNKTSLNWIGGILFIIGLIGAFTYFRRNE